MAKTYSLDLRERVVMAVISGQSCRAAASHFGVSISSACCGLLNIAGNFLCSSKLLLYRCCNICRIFIHITDNGTDSFYCRSGFFGRSLH